MRKAGIAFWRCQLLLVLTVVDVIGSEEIEKYRRIAGFVGAVFRVRRYMDSN